MRMMLKVQFPVEAANKAIKDGSLPNVLQTTLEELKPEASYYFADSGKRTALIFFDLKEPSQIPVVAEPFFMGLNASVDFIPVMNAQELQAGIEKAATRV